MAETLLAVMLLLIVAAMLTQGIPLAFNAYKKVDQAANANMLLSTTMTELRDKLSFSDEVTVSGNTVSFVNGAGRKYTLSYDSVKGGLYIEDVSSADYNPGAENDSYLLVSDAAASKELYVYYDNAEKSTDGNVLKFTKLAVYSKSDASHANPYIKIDEFDVRLIKNGK